MRTVKSRKLLWLIPALLIAMGASDCSGKTDSRKQGEQRQEEIMQRAAAAVPIPNVTNFSTRETVAKWMKRMDQKNKLFYIYIMADNGSFVAYHVAKNRPVNICTLLTPPDREVATSGQGANPLGAAPALDGVFYLGGGCNSNYFFDAETDALVELQSSMKYLTYDQPLAVDVPKLVIDVQESE